jgi:flagellin-like protein
MLSYKNTVGTVSPPVKELATVRSEDAVSPVIGVILMVAIVVILAAVIAAFVFGMAGSTGTSKNIGMTVSPIPMPTGGISILWQGGTDLNSLNSIAGSIGSELIAPYSDWTGDGGNSTHPTVGEITDLAAGVDTTGQRVILTGTFSDGSSQVIFDRRY